MHESVSVPAAVPWPRPRCMNWPIQDVPIPLLIHVLLLDFQLPRLVM